VNSTASIRIGDVQRRDDGPRVSACAEASIVVLAYNVSGYILECVETALDQRGVVCEVILVDDGSAEDLPSILGSDILSRIRYVRQHNGGRSLARNTGVLAARTGHIAFLDGDDMLERDHVARCLSLSSDADVVVPDAKMFGSGPRSGMLLSEATLRMHPVSFESFMRGQSGLVGTSFFRRDALIAVGGYEPTLPMAEDLHIHAKLLHHGARYRYSDCPTYLYRRHAESSTVKDLVLLHRCTLEALDLLASLPLSESDLCALRDKHKETKRALSMAVLHSAIRRRDWTSASMAFEEFNFATLSTVGARAKWRLLKLAMRVLGWRART
jgi:GT2 family glycosyltransferase